MGPTTVCGKRLLSLTRAAVLCSARGLRGHATGAAALLASALALLAAGCGGGTHPSVASLGTTTGAAATTPSPSPTPGGAPAGVASAGPGGGGGGSQLTMVGGNAGQMRTYASCMRSHGEPNFPDPNSQGEISISSGSGIDPSSPQFQTAQQACEKLIPHGALPSPAQQEQLQRELLAYSACMRSHGEPGFPDPSFSSGGHVSLSISSSSGVDPRSPQFATAQKACASDLPGRLGGGPLGKVGKLGPGAAVAGAGGGG